MSRSLSALVAALMLSGSVAFAQTAQLTVIHAIPGLPEAVTVSGTGIQPFSFDFTDIVGPVAIPAGAVAYDVTLQGNVVLSLSATLQADRNYTAIAHLTETGGIALTAFENDISALASNDSRLTVRHAAEAPAVDVFARRFFSWRTATLATGATNGAEATVDVRAGRYFARINAAGTRDTVATARLNLPTDTATIVYAVGTLGTPSFQLLTQTIDLSAATPAPGLAASVSGTSCATGTIGISTMTPAFGTAFDVTLTGGEAGATGFFHAGNSDDRFFFFSLPLSLDFLGSTGCFLYQNTPIIVPQTLDANGDASVEVTIPVSLAGRFDGAFFQYSYFDSNAAGLGLVLTELLTVE